MRYIIATTIITLAAVTTLTTAPARADQPDAERAADQSVVGTWDGHTNVMGQQLRIIVALTRSESGELEAAISIPAQMVSDQPLSNVAFQDGTLSFEWPMVNAKWSLQLSDQKDTAEGTLQQNGMEFPTTLKKLAEGETVDTSINRPQTPVPPYPYETREVEFNSKTDAIKLAATICIPEGDGPHPAVVFITGSGPQDRDETIFGHKPFLVLADDLARHGIASLRYDDRGVGGSEGDLSQATTQIFAGDVLGAIEELQSTPEIARDRIGLIGHSEGGLIAPAVAAKSTDVAFIVLLAGTGVTGEEVLKEQVKAILEAAGADPATTALQLADQRKTFTLIKDPDRKDELSQHVRTALRRQMPALDDSALEEMTRAQVAMVTSPWFLSFMHHDPRVALRETKCPVLAINGTKDVQVLHWQNLPEIENALQEAGNKDVTIRELPGLNHMFQQCDTGSIEEYAQIEQTIDPRVVKMVREWIRDRSGVSGD